MTQDTIKDITDNMLYAAVKQGVKDGIFPKHSDTDTYMHIHSSVKRMLEEAFDIRPITVNMIGSDTSFLGEYWNEDNTYAIILKHHGPKKIAVIKYLRARFNLGLKTAKEMSEVTSDIIKCCSSCCVANSIVNDLRSIDAKVELSIFQLEEK